MKMPPSSNVCGRKIIFPYAKYFRITEKAICSIFTMNDCKMKRTL